MTDKYGFLAVTRMPPDWSSVARHFKFVKEMFDEVNRAEGRKLQEIRAIQENELLAAEMMKANQINDRPLRVLSLGKSCITTLCAQLMLIWSRWWRCSWHSIS
jgi:hypothetical protein